MNRIPPFFERHGEPARTRRNRSRLRQQLRRVCKVQALLCASHFQGMTGHCWYRYAVRSEGSYLRVDRSTCYCSAVSRPHDPAGTRLLALTLRYGSGVPLHAEVASPISICLPTTRTVRVPRRRRRHAARRNSHSMSHSKRAKWSFLHRTNIVQQYTYLTTRRVYKSSRRACFLSNVWAESLQVTVKDERLSRLTVSPVRCRWQCA